MGGVEKDELLLETLFHYSKARSVFVNDHCTLLVSEDIPPDVYPDPTRASRRGPVSLGGRTVDGVRDLFPLSSWR